MPDIKKLDLNDPDTKSVDIVAGNIEALKALFPEAVTEGKIDFEVLKGLLGAAVDERDEKYGLNWHGKRRARQIALTPSTGTLLPCPEESVDWDTTQNLMIEGENLEVLKLLQKSYAGKVKLIYIDPPYNTGKDFVYPDDFQESIKNYLELTGQVEGARKISSNTEASGRFHTDWLNMMYPRLKLAKSLLLNDGLIFISIDSIEAANLRVMMDEIFGSENFIGLLPTVMNLKGNNDAFAFSDTHEFTVAYAKSKKDCAVYELPIPEDNLDDWLEDEWGLYKKADTLRRTGQDASRDRRPKGWFPVFIDTEGAVYATEDDKPRHDGDTVLWPVNDTGDELSWTWSKAKINDEPHNLIIVDGREGKNIYKKQRPGLGDLPTTKPKSIIYKPEYSSGNGTAELSRLMGSNVFDSPPKPRSLIRDFILVGSGPEAIILDFFAGTGTTGHAVMGLNARDGGRRRFILVQLPQKIDSDNKEQKVAAEFCKSINRPMTIAEITKERLRRASAAIKSDTTSKRTDFGFRSFRLATSNIVAWEPEPTDLEGTLLANAEHLVPGRTEQDVLYELLLKLGLDLCVPIEARTIAGKSVHSIGGGVLIVCLADGLTKDVIEPLASGIAAWREALAPAGDTSIVFKDSGFADDIAKTNMAAILNQNGITDVRSL
jgi:adenine-specific DNA-methyltransferase